MTVCGNSGNMPIGWSLVPGTTAFPVLEGQHECITGYSSIRMKPGSRSKDTSSSGRREIHSFANDVEPLLYGRPSTYVDVGAFNGQTYNDLLDCPLDIRAAQSCGTQSAVVWRTETGHGWRISPDVG
jgi:hypothetical protein